MISNFGRCTNCFRYGWLPHNCKQFEICIEGDEDWQEQWGADEEEALKLFAEIHDGNGDYSIVQAGECGKYFMLIREPDGEPKRFHVYGEMVPSYHAFEEPKQ